MNRAPAAAVKNTRIAADAWRKSQARSRQILIPSEVEEWSEWDERHGRKCREGSGERVGRRTSSISNYFEISIPLWRETPVDVTSQDRFGTS
jgi:hypothetical protein